MQASSIRAGAGKAVIQLPEVLFPVEGFTGIHDDICVRAILLEEGIRIAILSLELTSIPTEEATALRILVGTKANIPPENVWICVTHTFSAPHFKPRFMLKTEEDLIKDAILRQAIQDAVGSAVLQATDQLQDATIGIETGKCSVNVNRDIPVTEGWWLGNNESGLSDKTVTVIRLNTTSGEPIAFLFHYGVQSSVMDGSVMSEGGKKVSADLAGAASRYVERIYGGKVKALFCIGAAGDQAPALKAKYLEMDSTGKLHETDIHEEGFVLTRQLGERLGAEVVRIAEKTACVNSTTYLSVRKSDFQCPGQQMPRDIHSIHPTKDYRYLPDIEREMSVEAIRIGELVLLGTRPELNCCTSMQLKEGSEFMHTLVLTMVNGGAKYMADQDSYKHITYEAMNSSFAVGSAEILRDHALTLLKEMKLN